MLAAVLDVVPQIAIQVSQFLVLTAQSRDLLVAFIDLIHSKSKGILRMVHSLGEIVVPHDLSLSPLVVVDPF